MSAYRTASPPAAVREPSWLDRMMCRITGHRWRTVRVNRFRAAGLGHLHPMAGHDAVCTRCHAHWLDVEPITDMIAWNRCASCGRLESEPCAHPPEVVS